MAARGTVDEKGHDRKPSHHEHNFVPDFWVDALVLLEGGQSEERREDRKGTLE